MMPDQNNNNHAGLIAGGALAAAALGAIALMTLHPTTGSPGHDSVARELIAESTLNSFVHGGMIGFVLVFYFALSALSRRLNESHSSVRAAQLLFGAATIAMTGAALVSGFIVPGLAEHYVDVADDQVFRAQLLALSETNQTLAKAGSLFYGVAILLWSIRLVVMSGLPRIAGFGGLFVGPVIAIGILTGHLVLNVHGMGLVIVLMGVWFMLIALQLIRGSV